MKKRFFLFLKLAVMAVLLLFLYRKADCSEFRAAFAEFQAVWLLPIYALCLVNSTISAWKWKLFLGADGVHVSLLRLLGSYLIASFFNLFLPSSIGGDAYRVVEVRRHGGAAKSLASVLADRLTGFLALAVWGLFFAVIGGSRLEQPRLLIWPVILFLLVFGVVLAIFQRTWLVAIFRALRMNRIPRLDNFVQRVFDSLSRYSGNWLLLVKAFGISLFFQFTAIVIVFFISRAMSWDVPFLYFSVFVPLIAMGEALPISIFGIGVRDGLYVFFFTQAGATHEQALSLALIYVLVTLVYSLSGGVIFLLRRSAGGAIPVIPVEAESIPKKENETEGISG